VRLGLHCGPVVAGVIGEKRLAYDLWGSTVNLASRLESRGVTGQIHISQQARDALGPDYLCELRRGTVIKGVGTIDTWFLTGKHVT